MIKLSAPELSYTATKESIIFNLERGEVLARTTLILVPLLSLLVIQFAPNLPQYFSIILAILTIVVAWFFLPSLIKLDLPTIDKVTNTIYFGLSRNSIFTRLKNKKLTNTNIDHLEVSPYKIQGSKVSAVLLSGERIRLFNTSRLSVNDRVLHLAEKLSLMLYVPIYPDSKPQQTKPTPRQENE